MHSMWRIENPHGGKRVLVTKALPGRRWLNYLAGADCRVEICSRASVLSPDEIRSAMGTRCLGVIGQLTEDWNQDLFASLAAAGGRVFSNYAVGYNNVDVDAATRLGIAVGNTPGVLTEATAEMAVALTLAAARRTGEAERFMRAGRYAGWLPDLMLGKLLRGATLGIIGAGRIGSAYARMMVQGFGMNLVYFNRTANPVLEESLASYNRFLADRGEERIAWQRAQTLDELLRVADCVSLHLPLNDQTRHLIDGRRLALMKTDAVLVNTSRGAVIDEAALTAHCRHHPEFRAGLDVFEDEPLISPGLETLENVVIVPHIASATRWTREGMAALAAANVAGVLRGFPAWGKQDVRPFLADGAPDCAPSIINAAALGYPIYSSDSH